MPIKFLNVPASTNLRTSRPTGYKYPVGLSGTSAGVSTVDYLVVAGGGEGAGGIGGGSGGGGAGGLLTGSGVNLSNNSSFAITIGGGAPAASGEGVGPSGSYSLFTSSAPANTFYHYAVGGGGGAYGFYTGSYGPVSSGAGGADGVVIIISEA